MDSGPTNDGASTPGTSVATAESPRQPPGDEAAQIELHLVERDGTTRWLRVTTLAIADLGTDLHTIVFVLDITAQGRALARRRQASTRIIGVEDAEHRRITQHSTGGPSTQLRSCHRREVSGTPSIRSRDG